MNHLKFRSFNTTLPAIDVSTVICNEPIRHVNDNLRMI